MLIVCPLPNAERDVTDTRWMWVRSRDGAVVESHGEDACSALPRDTDCVLALPPQQVRWHHIKLPPHPSAKRAAVIAGVLDTAVLGEPEQLHAALPANFNPSEANWLAVTDKAQLHDHLNALQSVGLKPSRIMPLITPSDSPHALAWPHEGGWCVALSGPEGLVHIGAAQTSDALHELGADVLQAWQALRCPSSLAASVESAWPEHPIQVLSAQAILLQACASDWNLAQFEFRVSAAQRRTQGLQHAWRQLRHAPAWRPVRSGLMVALLAALALPPAWAWREQQVQRDLSAQARALVQETFPQIKLVIEPAVQMRRALDALAQTRGLQSTHGLAQLLSTLGQLPQTQVTQVRWQNQQADLQIAGTTTAALEKLLQPLGWQVQAQGPQLWRISVKGSS